MQQVTYTSEKAAQNLQMNCPQEFIDEKPNEYFWQIKKAFTGLFVVFFILNFCIGNTKKVLAEKNEMYWNVRLFDGRHENAQKQSRRVYGHNLYKSVDFFGQSLTSIHHDLSCENENGIDGNVPDNDNGGQAIPPSGGQGACDQCH